MGGREGTLPSGMKVLGLVGRSGDSGVEAIAKGTRWDLGGILFACRRCPQMSLDVLFESVERWTRDEAVDVREERGKRCFTGNDMNVSTQRCSPARSILCKETQM